MNIIRGGVFTLAGLVGAGVVAWPAVAQARGNGNGDDAAIFKRDDQAVELVAVQDDDDDDTNDDETNNTNTGVSNPTNDNTASNFTAVSRDRDLSRSDKTKDWTKDGGDPTRDVTADGTNDQSRNDTRARR